MIIPEIYCENIEISKTFYTGILGMNIEYERVEEKFVFLSLYGSSVMLEQLQSPSRKFLTGQISKPFGRGVNFQWDVIDIDSYHHKVLNLASANIFLPLELKEYNCKQKLISQKQFIVKDPDGYLIRFCENSDYL